MAKIANDKTANTVLISSERVLYLSWMSEILQSENRNKFANDAIINYFKANKIKFIHGRPYNPQTQ